jgi:hypothetical protein
MAAVGVSVVVVVVSMHGQVGVRLWPLHRVCVHAAAVTRTTAGRGGVGRGRDVRVGVLMVVRSHGHLHGRHAVVVGTVGGVARHGLRVSHHRVVGWLHHGGGGGCIAVVAVHVTVAMAMLGVRVPLGGVHAVETGGKALGGDGTHSVGVRVDGSGLAGALLIIPPVGLARGRARGHARRGLVVTLIASLASAGLGLVGLLHLCLAVGCGVSHGGDGAALHVYLRSQEEGA